MSAPSLPAGLLWASLPVATSLHPAAPDYGERYQHLLEVHMGSPVANPAFGPVVAEADVHWRLLGATGSGLPVDAATAERWRDTALAGVAVAVDALIDETLARAPQLDAARTVLETLASPGLVVARDRRGVQVRPGRARDAARERAAEEVVVAARARPPPALKAGLDLTLRPLDAPEADPLVAWGVYASGDRVGLTAFRMQADARDLRWSITARQLVYPRVSLVAALRSVEPLDRPPNAPLAVPDPGRWSTGVAWSTNRGWDVRVERAETLADGGWTWTISLRSERRGPIPGRVSPGLGAREPEASGLPWVGEHGPNATATW